MKIMVLEHPRSVSETRFNDIANTPLWSCLVGGYVASSLIEAGFDTGYIDASKNGWGYEELQEKVFNDSPALLCINTVYIWEHTGKLFAFIAGLRRMGFEGHINLFGFFPTLAHKDILDNAPGVDSIAVGECEATITELASCLACKKDFLNVAGLAVRYRGKSFLALSREPATDPDRFPEPVRLERPDETAMVLASRGCYNHCTFCPIPPYYNGGPLWRGRAPERVAGEISRLREKGHKSFYFADPNFIGPGKKGRERTEKLIAILNSFAIQFGMETRPGDLDEDMLKILSAAGLESLLIGIESGSAPVLGVLDKHGSLDTGGRAIDLCRSVGIEPEVGFLMFVPDSTIEDIRRNFDFLFRNSLLDRLVRTVNLLSHKQVVLMGTSGYSRFESEGRLLRTGFIGFEGDVLYKDQRVSALSETIIPVCLNLIRSMSDVRSPLYWENDPKSPDMTRTNNDLVAFFQDMLSRVEAGKSLPGPSGFSG